MPEWESLCDGCGQCCLHKLMDEDTDEIYFTNVACRQLNIKTCQCRHYERRFEFEPDCIKLTRDNLPDFEWLPMTCAYRLLAEGQTLPAWHPLPHWIKSRYAWRTNFCPSYRGKRI
ncbi:putative cytoplasmic protein [Salmonella bongori]|nr:putative cytoplasmic protein [Salmonella bongori]